MLATYLNQNGSVAVVPVQTLASLNTITASDAVSITFGSTFSPQFSLIAFGAGITDDGAGVITGGTINRVEFYENGFLQLRLEGFATFDATLAAASFTGGSLPGYDLLIAMHAGASIASGSAANDWIDTGSGNDQVSSGDGNDRVSKFMAGNLAYNGGLGADTLNLGAENGLVYPTPYVQQFVVDLTLGTGQNPYGGAFLLRSVENVIGTSAADRITGSDAANVIGDGTFDRGADIIDARGGDDTVKMNIQESGVVADGGTGIDTLFIDTASPHAGWNIFDLETAASNSGVFLRNSFTNFENVTFWQNEPLILLDFRGNALANAATGGWGNDRLAGRAGHDRLDGGEGNDILDGGEGFDTMFGGGGNDIFYVDSGRDTVVEYYLGGTDTVRSAASYILPYGIETLTLLGAANLRATGNFADNAIVGNSGNNLIIGGGGADRLLGGGGNDIFRYEYLSDSGIAANSMDQIRDFSAGDRIDLRAIDADYTVDGDQAFVLDTDGVSAPGEISFQQAAGRLIVNLYYDLVTNPDPSLRLYVFGVTVLGAADFML